MGLGELVICKCESWVALDCLIQHPNSLGQALYLGCTENGQHHECFSSYVQIMSGKISRWFLLDCGLFAWRNFGLKLRNYLPSHLTFDCKYIGNIAIVAFRPKLTIRTRIDVMSVYAHVHDDNLYI